MLFLKNRFMCMKPDHMSNNAFNEYLQRVGHTRIFGIRRIRYSLFTTFLPVIGWHESKEIAWILVDSFPQRGDYCFAMWSDYQTSKQYCFIVNGMSQSDHCHVSIVANHKQMIAFLTRWNGLLSYLCILTIIRTCSSNERVVRTWLEKFSDFF